MKKTLSVSLKITFGDLFSELASSGHEGNRSFGHFGFSHTVRVQHITTHHINHLRIAVVIGKHINVIQVRYVKGFSFLSFFLFLKYSLNMSGV